MQLVEDGPDSGIFTGFLPTGTGAAVTDDGILQSAHGDLVTGRYDDADDGDGNPTISIYTIPADCAGAGIEPVSVAALTDADAVITWSTSKPTTGYVEWGATPALGTVVASNGSNQSHNATIGPFASCGRVYFRVVATDEYGNTSVAEAEGSPFEFNALGVPGVYYVDDFEIDAGWTLEGEWEIRRHLAVDEVEDVCEHHDHASRAKRTGGQGPRRDGVDDDAGERQDVGMNAQPDAEIDDGAQGVHARRADHPGKRHGATTQMSIG